MIGAVSAVGLAAGSGAPPSGKAGGFAHALDKALTQLNQMEGQGQAAMVNLAAGKGTLEQAIVATEQSTLAIDLTAQVGKRVIQAYQSLWSLQI